MEQTKIESKIETAVDILTGIVQSWVVMLWIIPIPFPDYVGNHEDALGVVLIFTIFSAARKYGWRRFFSRGFHKIVHKYLTRLLA